MSASSTTPITNTVTVHALSAGTVTLPLKTFIEPVSNPDELTTLPCTAFLIQHTDPSTKTLTRLVFDLGIRRDMAQYPPRLYQNIIKRQPTTGTPDITEALSHGGLRPNDIDYVVFSHLHWDHVGTPSDFPQSTFVIGPGSKSLLLGTAAPDAIGSNSFEPDLLPLDRTVELSEPAADKPSQGYHNSQTPALFAKPWKQLANFPHTMDIFGDGSLHIVSAPGHLLGHINLLCRVQQDKYVYLAGDAFHDMRILTGDKQIATWDDRHNPSIRQSIHYRIEDAKATIDRIAQAGSGTTSLGHVEVIIAHDPAWAQHGKKNGRFWPGKL